MEKRYWRLWQERHLNGHKKNGAANRSMRPCRREGHEHRQWHFLQTTSSSSIARILALITGETFSSACVVAPVSSVGAVSSMQTSSAKARRLSAFFA